MGRFVEDQPVLCVVMSRKKKKKSNVCDMQGTYDRYSIYLPDKLQLFIKTTLIWVTSIVSDSSDY